MRYHFGQSNYRSREVGEAFRNLDDAKVIQLLYPTTNVEIPVKTGFTQITPVTVSRYRSD